MLESLARALDSVNARAWFNATSFILAMIFEIIGMFTHSTFDILVGIFWLLAAIETKIVVMRNG
jgi:hypothetical protein